jgi:hypothetical protein
MILVRFLDLKFLYELAAQLMGTANSAALGRIESGAQALRIPDVNIPSTFPKIYGERFVKPSRLRLGNRRRKVIGAQGNTLIVAFLGP